MLHIEEGKDDLAGKDKNLNTNADKGEKDFEAKNALIIESLREKWGTLKGRNSHDCIRIFLTCTRKWQFFGSKLFEVQVMPHILSKIVLRFNYSPTEEIFDANRFALIFRVLMKTARLTYG